MSYYKLLIVDDEAGIREQLLRWLNNEGFSAEQAAAGQEALNLLKKRNFNIVLLDLRLPDMSGFRILEEIRKSYPDICTIVLTGYGNDASLQEARKAGAFDFLTKPFQFSDLGGRIDAAMRQFMKHREVESQTEEQRRHFQFENIIGESPAMQQVYDKIKTVAPTDETVLILGESGTGKELVAGAIHYNSRRRQHRLIMENCSVIQANLVESELFGHEKGAFTSASARKIGKFELAHEKSLFLDEIGELSLALQVKFLQFLQYRTFERVGGNEPIQVDVRVIAATNKDLPEAVENKEFREDLFYRLDRFSIRVPPLRERVSDIPLLVNHFIKKANRRNNQNVEGVSDSALDLLQSHDYPGNVRELENIIVQAMLYNTKPIIQADTIRSCIRPSKAMNGKMHFHDMAYREAKEIFERAYFAQMLELTNGNISRGAIKAGLDRTWFRKKLKELGLWTGGAD